MSIKIHSGLRATIKDPFLLGAKIREVLEPEFHKSFESLYAQAKAAPEGSTWDSVFYCGDYGVIENHSVDHFLYKIVKSLHENARHTFTDLDIGYNVTMMPNAAGGNPLVLVFGENQRKYTKLLIEAGVVEKYGYWDNADEDEDVTKEEWEERKQAWMVLDSAAPSEVGLEIQFPSEIATAVNLMK